MLEAQGVERQLNLPYGKLSGHGSCRILIAAGSLTIGAGGVPRLDQHESAPVPLAGLVDEPVVQDAGEPRAEVADARQLVAALVDPAQDILDQVFGIAGCSGQPVGEPVEAIQMRSDEASERVVRVAA